MNCEISRNFHENQRHLNGIQWNFKIRWTFSQRSAVDALRSPFRSRRWDGFFSSVFMPLLAFDHELYLNLRFHRKVSSHCMNCKIDPQKHIRQLEHIAFSGIYHELTNMSVRVFLSKHLLVAAQNWFFLWVRLSMVVAQDVLQQERINKIKKQIPMIRDVFSSMDADGSDTKFD